ncbi:MAG: metallophosphoesterase, partial [Pseudomonadota bacterium]
QSDKVGTSRRLVQLTDVHLGSLGANTLSRAMARAVAQQPDAILITGDLVDGGEIGAAQLGALAVEHPPVYMVIGNHERYVKLDALLRDIRAQQVTVLRNASETLGDLQLLGVDDSDAPHYLVDALPNVPVDPARFSVLLYHKPDDWDAAQSAGVDLMLSGHTHAGQVWPFSVLVRRRHPHWRGLYSAGQHHLYVAPGTGCWGPIFRIGSRAEITVIDIDPA